MAQRIETLAVECGATLGEIARHALDAGLPVIEGDSLPAVAPSSDSDARRWWETLHRGERRNWSRRLPHLKGPAFFVEAYRQDAMGEKQPIETKR